MGRSVLLSVRGLFVDRRKLLVPHLLVMRLNDDSVGIQPLAYSEKIYPCFRFRDVARNMVLIGGQTFLVIGSVDGRIDHDKDNRLLKAWILI